MPLISFRFRESVMLHRRSILPRTTWEVAFHSSYSLLTAQVHVCRLLSHTYKWTTQNNLKNFETH